MTRWPANELEMWNQMKNDVCAANSHRSIWEEWILSVYYVCKVSIVKSTKTDLASHGRRGQKYRKNLKWHFLSFDSRVVEAQLEVLLARPHHVTDVPPAADVQPAKIRQTSITWRMDASESGRRRNCLAILNFAPRKNKSFPIIRGQGIYDICTEQTSPTEMNLVRLEREVALKYNTETEIDHIMVQTLEEYRSCWVAWLWCLGCDKYR